jgi:subtilisin family serine protease
MPPADPVYGLPPFTVESQVSALAGETIDWGLKAHGVEAAWAKSRGKDVRVAVLDTGIDQQHFQGGDLKGVPLAMKNFTNSPNAYWDLNGHGTHTAGTIAAPLNGSGVVGVAPLARLLVGKVLGDTGSGNGSWIAAGIDWSVAQGAELVSMSLGSPQADNTIYQAIKRAVAAGVHVVCAAGNEGGVPGQNTVGYPARFREVMAVGAYAENGLIAKFSSQGPEVDIACPGQQILSTYKNGSYARLSGTSMATPFAAGLMALLLAYRRDNGLAKLAPAELITFFEQRSKDAGELGVDIAFGYGKPDLGQLLSGGGSGNPGEPGGGAPGDGGKTPGAPRPGSISYGPLTASVETIGGQSGLFVTVDFSKLLG